MRRCFLSCAGPVIRVPTPVSTSAASSSTPAISPCWTSCGARTSWPTWLGGTRVPRWARTLAAACVASSAVAVISVPGGTLTDYARGGSAVEAVWITAQQRGLAVQPISPVFLYARDVDELAELSTSFADELDDLQKEFRQLVGMPADAFRCPGAAIRLSAARLRCEAGAVSSRVRYAVAPIAATVWGCPARWTIWSRRRPPS